jgi:hypothetical protein
MRPWSFLGLRRFGPTRHTRDEMTTRRSRDGDPPSDMAYWKGYWKDEREGERAELVAPRCPKCGATGKKGKKGNKHNHPRQQGEPLRSCGRY